MRASAWVIVLGLLAAGSCGKSTGTLDKIAAKAATPTGSDLMSRKEFPVVLLPQEGIEFDFDRFPRPAGERVQLPGGVYDGSFAISL